MSDQPRPGRASSDGAVPVMTFDGPRWSQIASALAQSIEGGRWPDGATLPSAAAVAAEYGVHRHTVRQAFRHLQDLGLVSVERGRGTVVTGRRFPYRIGRRVSFRTNFGAAGLAVRGEIATSRLAEATPDIAARLGLAPSAAIWEIRTVNRVADVPVSTGLHRLSLARFPGFEARLRAAQASMSAGFAAYGITDYVRLSTRLSARLPTAEEAAFLSLEPGVPVMQTASLDGLQDGTPLQTIDGIFVGASVEFVIEPEA